MSADAAEDAGASTGAWRQRLRRQLARALTEQRLVAPDDRIMVALSGGKDSWALLHLLLNWSRSAPFSVSVTAGHIALGPDGERLAGQLAASTAGWGVPLHVRRTRIAENVWAKLAPGASPCALCARLRRGALLRAARDASCNVIALGHHADDMIETFLLNLFYTGRLETMPAAMTAGPDAIRIIRPMCYCAGQDVAALARTLPVASPPGACALGIETGSERLRLRRLLDGLAQDNRHVRGNALKAIGSLIKTKPPGGAPGASAHD